MTRTAFAMGSMTFIGVIAVGSLSVHLVDRHFAIAETNKKRAPNDSAPASSPSSGPCVAADGSWKNWVWANVPMLSPKCAVDR
jgi:hypothetical protein